MSTNSNASRRSSPELAIVLFELGKPRPGRLEGDQLPVVADVVVERFVADQFRSGFFDQRNETVFQSVHFLGPQLDGKIGESLQMPDTSADTITRLEDREIFAGGGQALRRGQSGRPGPDDDDRRCAHARGMLTPTASELPRRPRAQPHSGGMCFRAASFSI